MIIEGIPSGDLECWCLLVTKKTFEALTGRAPDHEIDIGRFAKKGSKYKYAVYPDDLLGIENHGLGKEEIYLISAVAVKKKDLDSK